MKTSSLNRRINIHYIPESDDVSILLIWRNNAKEVLIKGFPEDVKAAERYLRKVINKDYQDYMECYDLDEDAHLSNYFWNAIKYDEKLHALLIPLDTKFKFLK